MTTSKAGVFPRQYIQLVENEKVTLLIRPPLPVERPEYIEERLEQYSKSEEFGWFYHICSISHPSDIILCGCVGAWVRECVGA